MQCWHSPSPGDPRTDRADPDASQGPGGLSTCVSPALAWVREASAPAEVYFSSELGNVLDVAGSEDT